MWVRRQWEGFSEDGDAEAFPPVNVWTSEQGLVVRCEVPGVEPESLDVSATPDVLILRGRREESLPAEEEKVSYLRRERWNGVFVRTLSLPAQIDADRVEARVSRGILTVGAPFDERIRPRKISVRA